MIDCTFDLNGKRLSELKCGAYSFPAFSGLGHHANRKELACLAGAGPIPPGEYFIVDRQSGGLLGPLRDLLSGHGEWFALYAADGKVDDETFCQKVRRGQFRLHPKGAAGISQGCVTLELQTDYRKLRALLKSQPPETVAGTPLKAYGKVVVK
jgi:hypothetical protein